MKHKHLEHDAQRWISSERDGRLDEADAALMALFQAVPLAVPSADFAGRVLAQSGIVAKPASSWSWIQKTVLAASLLLAGLAAAVAPGLIVELFDPLQPVRLVEWGASLLLGLIHWFANGMSFWSALADAGHGIQLAFFRPSLMLAAAAGLLLSVTAFRLLYGLLTPDRGRSHYGT